MKKWSCNAPYLDALYWLMRRFPEWDERFEDLDGYFLEYWRIKYALETETCTIDFQESLARWPVTDDDCKQLVEMTKDYYQEAVQALAVVVRKLKQEAAERRIPNLRLGIPNWLFSELCLIQAPEELVGDERMAWHRRSANNKLFFLGLPVHGGSGVSIENSVFCFRAKASMPQLCRTNKEEQEYQLTTGLHAWH